MSDNNAKAVLKNLHIAPRKVRLVTDVIKGLHVEDALAQLDTMTKRSSGAITKLIRSAVANAKEKNMNTDHLVIQSIRVDKGQMFKRALPRARGRATPLQKKMSHVYLELVEMETAEKPKFEMPEIQKKVKETRTPKVKSKRQKRQTDAEEKKKERKGFMKKVFQRKSI